MKSLPPWRAQGEVMAHLSVVVVAVVWGVWVGDEEPTSLVSTGGRECRRAYLLGEHRGEAEVFVGAADPDTGRDDHLPGGVQVGEVHLVLAEVRGGVVETVHLVVVLDDPVQDRGKDCVGIRVTGVDAHTTVRVLASCTQRGNRVK